MQTYIFKTFLFYWKWYEKVFVVLNIWIEGQRVEQVTKYKYLGGYISEDKRCYTEIKIILVMTKDAK